MNLFLGNVLYTSPGGIQLESSDMWGNARSWEVFTHLGTGPTAGSRLIRARIKASGIWAGSGGIWMAGESENIANLEFFLDGIGMSLDELGIEYEVKRFERKDILGIEIVPETVWRFLRK
jgi:hypothetical protein